MRIYDCKSLFGFAVVLVLTMGEPPALAQDCNGNGIQDSLDLLPTPFGLPETPDLVSILVGVRPTSVIATARDLNGDWISLDVNEDGLVDMATTPSGEEFITVLINNGVDSSPDGVVAISTRPSSFTSRDIQSPLRSRAVAITEVGRTPTSMETRSGVSGSPKGVGSRSRES